MRIYYCAYTVCHYGLPGGMVFRNDKTSCLLEGTPRRGYYCCTAYSAAVRHHEKTNRGAQTVEVIYGSTGDSRASDS